jgi:hypothetical protein
MTREEAVAELARRWRFRLVCQVQHGDAGTELRGATMGETPAELRAAVHGLLDAMLDRALKDRAQ